MGGRIAPFGIVKRVQREKLSNVKAIVRLLLTGDATSQVRMGDVWAEFRLLFGGICLLLFVLGCCLELKESSQ